MAQGKREVGWAEIHRHVGTLALSIPQDKYDTFLAPTRGGLIPAGMLAHYFPRSLVIQTIKSIRYASSISATEDAQLSFMPNLHGRKVLLVDDIVDQGETVAAIRRYYQNLQIGFDVAALFVRQGQEALVQYSGEVAPEEEWIVFPWEPAVAEENLPF